MKLLTKEIKEALPKLYSTEGNPDPMVVCKFFTPDSGMTFYITEGEEQEDGDWLLFGLVDGQVEELGYMSLREIESARGPWGLPVERDRYWSPRPLSQAKRS